MCRGRIGHGLAANCPRAKLALKKVSPMEPWVMEYTVTWANFSVGSVLNALNLSVFELSASKGAIFQGVHDNNTIPRGLAKRSTLSSLRSELGPLVVSPCFREKWQKVPPGKWPYLCLYNKKSQFFLAYDAHRGWETVPLKDEPHRSSSLRANLLRPHMFLATLCFINTDSFQSKWQIYKGAEALTIYRHHCDLIKTYS